MRFIIILAAMCVFLFLGAWPVKADELSDLKAQIEALQQTNQSLQQTIESLKEKVEAVERKQEAQAQKVAKVPELEQKVEGLKQSKAPELLEGTHVGGHLKIYMFDRTAGKRNGVNQHTDASAGIHHAYVFLSKQLDDWLGLDLQVDNSVSASATPSLGSDIARATSASSTTSIYQAFMTMQLPKGFEMRVGILNPVFSEEYAKEIWWHEQYHQNKGLVNLQSWHDNGIELYKNWDFDKWSLPIYVYYLNGTSGSSRYVDNNEDKTFLIHVAPELFQSKLRIPLSFGYGKWDDADEQYLLRSAVGIDWKYKKFNLVGDYLYNKYDNVILSTATKNLGTRDGKQEGFFVKGLYRFSPKWLGMVKYSHAELYKTGLLDTMRSDNYDETTLALDYFLTPNSTIISQLSYGDAERSDSSEALEYTRFTLGWRTTF